ncbi:DNA-directed RNA polymerase subunit beta, partial [bacterium]|nr:DNA-directed RNA polymerase subunit beta [bacterium]
SYEIGNWSCTCGQLTGLATRYTKDKKTGRYITCSSCHARVSIKVPFNPQECRESEETYALPLKVRVQLITWDVDEQGNRSIHDIKEQDVYFADVPVMVDLYQDQAGTYQLGNQGTFVINGVDRVVVSQLHRSPGAVFSKSKKTKDLRGRPYFAARIIPMRGSWMDFEFDTNDCLYVRIDKKKKLLVTTFLQALGYTRDSLLSLFYNADVIQAVKGVFYKSIDENAIGRRIEKGMLDEKLDEKFAGKRITKEILADLIKAKADRLYIKDSSVLGKALLKDVVDTQTGEILIDQGTILQQHHIDMLHRYESITLELIDSGGYMFQPAIALTLAHDSVTNQNDALHEIHVKIWPGDSASLEEIKERLERQFFSDRYYDLTKVGRVRLNSKLGLQVGENVTCLVREDILGTIRYLINLREKGEGELDDIDHLGNRRVRLVGELLANQIYSGLARIERIAKERFRMQETHTALMPQDFLNVKPLSAVLREFFGSGQLSQFMDQTNPLSELAHKRRL